MDHLIGFLSYPPADPFLFPIIFSQNGQSQRQLARGLYVDRFNRVNLAYHQILDLSDTEDSGYSCHCSIVSPQQTLCFLHYFSFPSFPWVCIFINFIDFSKKTIIFRHFDLHFPIFYFLSSLR